jgi:hypothetical protein
VPEDPPGLGSRGKRRFYAFALWHGAHVVREAKPVIPSAFDWAAGSTAPPRLEELLESPARCPDPSQQVQGGWIVRRLAPDAVKIELRDLTGKGAARTEEETLFESMGAEIGRLHRAAPGGNLIAADLKKKNDRDKEWYAAAVKSWAKVVEEEQVNFA